MTNIKASVTLDIEEIETEEGISIEITPTWSREREEGEPPENISEWLADKAIDHIFDLFTKGDFDEPGESEVRH